MTQTVKINEFPPGSLVEVRDRKWIVLPSADSDLLLLKPLDGTDDEITGIYSPLGFEEDEVKITEFEAPGVDDLGSFASARLLYDAARLMVRNASGPFRSIAKLSFRPRAYQMVPLIMALRQEYPIRLLIADDVGVGKTIEALLILKELLERKEIKSFAIIVLPHLCEQWQEELRDKFGIEAVIIRSNTQARLDREIHGDTSVFKYYPFQIISIDYIKSDLRRNGFIQDCPEFVIVDEAHTCTTHSASNSTQQQRHKLIEDIIANDANRHLVLLTATPHSGKQEQFNSLLGLLKKEYEFLDLTQSTQQQRRELAKYFVQRRRVDVEKWSYQDTPFPSRDSNEIEYILSPKYEEFYNKARAFASDLVKSKKSTPGVDKIRSWAALALLRGVMSSPASCVEMLKNRLKKSESIDNLIDSTDQLNPIVDEDFSVQDYSHSNIFDQTNWSDKENSKLKELYLELEALHGLNFDLKAEKALQTISDWLRDKFNPVIFCRYIDTANYLGKILKDEFEQPGFDIVVRVVTSEKPDEERKTIVEDMKKSTLRVLVATDCLSEGINLQDLFNAVLHYDLPWNPNRLEQREGRVDRYGQQSKVVKTTLLYSKNNPIESIVLGVLLRKIRQIKQEIGISIPFPEDNQSFMDAVFQEVWAQPEIVDNSYQRSFNFEDYDPINQKKIIASKAIEEAADREKMSRTIFAQNAIKAQDIEQDLTIADKAIGTPHDVESFFTRSTALFGAQMSLEKDKKGYNLFTTNLPPMIKEIFPKNNPIKISFHSPTPEKYKYIGRNNLIVENMCRLLFGRAVLRNNNIRPSRAAVIKSSTVKTKTTILLLRVRNVIREKRKQIQLVAEEMIFWGYEGNTSNPIVLDESGLDHLINTASSTTPLSQESQMNILQMELEDIKNMNDTLNNVALNRAQLLVEAHERFRAVIGGKRYEVVEPVLPMDFIGVYILLPSNND